MDQRYFMYVEPERPTQEEYTIVYSDDPEWAIIGGGVREYNRQQAGEGRAKYISFNLHAPDDTIVGGIIAETHWNWLFINLMWIREDLRHQGFGHRLLIAVEDEARKRGATNAYVDTFDFQSPEFYKQHGYQVFGILHDFPPGHARYYLTKQL